MKKLLTIGLTLLLSASLLSGCGQSSTGTASDTNTAAGSSQAASDTNASGENTDEFFVWEGTVITNLTEKGEAAEELVIPDTATSIGFNACSFAKMKKLTLGANVEEIGEMAFDTCKNLEEITFPSSLKKIGNTAFKLCQNLGTVTFSEGLVEIGENVFFGTSVGTIVLPEGLTTIGSGAFNPCPYTTSMYLPASLENIPLAAFGFTNFQATIYVKEGSWADLHFDEYVQKDPFTKEVIFEKAYY